MYLVCVKARCWYQDAPGHRAPHGDGRVRGAAVPGGPAVSGVLGSERKEG